MIRESMARRSSAGAVVVAVLAGAVPACSDLTAPEDLLEVTVDVAPAELVPGATTAIHVVARNPTSLVLSFPRISNLLGVEILDAEGRTIHRGPGFVFDDRLLDGVSYLAPGEEIARSFQFGGYVHQYGPDGRPSWTPLPPGTYRVHGTAGSSGNRSPPVDLRILPAD